MDRHNLEEVRSYFGGYIPTDREGFFKYTLENMDVEDVRSVHNDGYCNSYPDDYIYDNDEYNFNKPYSDDTAQLIDKEVKKMIAEQYERAKSLLLEHRGGHAELAKVLVEKEVIFAEDVEKIFGKRPWTSRTEELLEMNKELPGDEHTSDLSIPKNTTANDSEANNHFVAEEDKE